MPAADSDLESDPKLPFDPIKKSHILHCSCHFWYPRYRTLTPKTRLIPLSPAFVSYLNADGIQLPPDGESQDEEFESDISTSANRTAEDSGEDEEDDEANEAECDPSLKWPEIHSSIASTIAELGGKVVPKLNWSAPKDATWINPTNSMDCRTPNDVYLLLKSSDFVTHDLEHAFDGCISDDEDEDVTLDINADESELPQSNGNGNHSALGLSLPNQTSIPYTLSLRKSFALNPSVEFRCFVRNRRILAISQRSVNYFDFLFPLAPQLQSLISEFFEAHLQNTFPDENYVFDVYIPDPYRRVWLIDFNPWAPRTDPLLFSWLELLTMEGPDTRSRGAGDTNGVDVSSENAEETDEDDGQKEEVEEEDADDELLRPEFRLIEKNDPEAYSFNTPQYSAHKLPKDVVEASQSGEGPLRELAEQWKEVLNRGQQS